MFAADENHIYITTHDKNYQNYMKTAMGASLSKKGYCKLPRTLAVIEELYKVIPELRSNQDFINQGFSLHAEKKKRLELLVTTEVQTSSDKLRPYQRSDVNFLKSLQSGGIFNEPRTGKTPITLTLIKELGTKLNLIVCPASLLWTWEKQIRQWVPDATPFVVQQSKHIDSILAAYKAVKGQSVMVVSKNLLSKLDLDLKVKMFDLVAVDEAHYLRNYKTTQSKAVYSLNANRRYAITGTPTVNHTIDIFGILKFLQPKVYKSYWNFADMYFTKRLNYFTGQDDVGPVKPEREKQLQELIALLSVSRKRSEVMSWLPAKEYTKIYTNMTARQKKYYDEMKRKFETYCDESGTEVDAQSALSQMMRLRQITLDPRTVGFKEIGCKTTLLKEWLSDNKRPVIIMSMFTGYLKILQADLEKEKYRVACIHGEMTAKKKQEAADAFQNGEVDVLLCNIISAGTGWTLDRGDTVIFMDTAWSPSDNEQAEDRVTPTNPENIHKHQIIHFTTSATIDEHIFDLLEEKKSLTDVINSGSGALRKLLIEGR